MKKGGTEHSKADEEGGEGVGAEVHVAGGRHGRKDYQRKERRVQT
jgi:hypothetical protein